MRQFRVTLRHLSAVGLVLLTALIVMAGYSAGFDRRVAPNEWGRFGFAISAALTEQIYGLRGGVSYGPVMTALRSHGFTGDANTLKALGTSYPDNFYSKKLMDSAIEKASNLKLTIPAPQNQHEGYDVWTSPGDDVGFAEFVLLSFSVFSHSIEALYLGFLVIFAGSVWLFWLAFRTEAAYVSVLMLTCAIFYVLFVSPLFPGNPALLGPGDAWTTPASPHFLSTLAIVPALHLLAIFCRRPRASLVQCACLIGQAVLLYFVIRVRLSSAWQIVPIAVAAMAMLLRPAAGASLTASDIGAAQSNSPAHEPRPSGSAVLRLLDPLAAWVRSNVPVQKWARGRPAALRFLVPVASWARSNWPILLLLLVLVGAHAGFESRLHPMYRDGRHFSHHAIWNEIYYGLQANPNWTAKYGDAHRINGELATGDQQPLSAISMYLDAHPEINRTSLLDPAGNLYWSAIETYSFWAFLDFAKNDPWFVLQTFGYKLHSVVLLLTASLGWIFGGLTLFQKLLCGAVVCYTACVFATIAPEERPGFYRYLALLFLCLPLAAMPNVIWLVGWELMADSFACWLLILGVLCALPLAAVISTVIEYASAPRGTAAKPVEPYHIFSPRDPRQYVVEPGTCNGHAVVTADVVGEQDGATPLRRIGLGG